MEANLFNLNGKVTSAERSKRQKCYFLFYYFSNHGDERKGLNNINEMEEIRISIKYIISRNKEVYEHLY